MKTVLIISPYFAPSNAADMHRIRMSLSYFWEFGWNAEIVTVNAKHADIVKDPLLIKSIPHDTIIHEVNALPKKLTSMLGLGSLALRSLWFYRKKVNHLLRKGKYDLIYFSTTQFPVCSLGAYWKQKFDIPYVIDMQDPWHSDYYRGRPKNERPPKYWFSYRLNKLLEPIAMNKVDGLISVSEAYIELLKARYPRVSKIPRTVLTFGYFERDFEIAAENAYTLRRSSKYDPSKSHLVYVGRGGFDMSPALRLLFLAFKELRSEESGSENIRFHFIGTSYAPAGQGRASIKPIAEELGIGEFVEESTDRITLYESIATLQSADGLIIPGSNDPGYTASKIYPYILARKPLLGIFQRSSSASRIISELDAGIVTDPNDDKKALKDIKRFLVGVLNKNPDVNTRWPEFELYSARAMTQKQCELFNTVIC